MTGRLSRTEVVIAITQTVAPVGVFAIVLAATARSGHWLSLETLYLLGTLAAALGVAAALWTRRWTTLFMSFVLFAIGVVTLALMTVFPNPQADPDLWITGVAGAPPIPTSGGWDRFMMSGSLLLSGATLPLALRTQRRSMALIGVTITRFCLWYGALWQLGYLSLGGDFAQYFAAETGGLQLCLLFMILIGWVLLLRGDRRWLNALTAADRSVALARFLMPLMLMPIVAAALLVLAARHRSFVPSMAPLLNAELNSIALVFVGLAALRGLWLERRRRSALSRAVESSPVMIHSAQGVIEYWPRGCETLFGYTAQEAVGRYSNDVLKTVYPLPFAEIEGIIKQTGEWAGEVRQTTRDGRRLWVATRIASDRPEPGSEIKLVETMTDITDLKLSNAALRDTTENLEQVVAGYGVGIISFWPRSGRAQFSPQMERMLGLEPGDLGTDQSIWLSLIQSDDVVRVATLLLEDAKRMARDRTVIFKAMHRDGRYRDLQGVIRYDYDVNGAASHIVGVYMDITEVMRDRVEMAARGARLLELQAELTHTSRLSAMGELAAGLAHELNQPLAAVGNSVGAIELLLRDDAAPLEGPLRQRLRNAARAAESQVVRAGEIVRRLREFISRGDADTRVEDLNTLVDDALALALPNPAANGVVVSRSIADEAAAVLAGRIQVQQVLVNLIRNALEATQGQEKPGELRIVAEACDGMALVRVIDNGSGVSEDRANILFSPFISSKREGMGLGLSISRRIIEAHGGKLWFEPAQGGGAQFCFTLPLAAGEAGSPEAMNSIAEADQSGARNPQS